MGMADEAEAYKPQSFGIWPENALTVRVFFDLEHLWIEKQTPDGLRPQGLDHGQIKHTLKLLNVKRRRRPQIYNDLKIMETEAIEVMRRG